MKKETWQDDLAKQIREQEKEGNTKICHHCGYPKNIKGQHWGEKIKSEKK